MVGQDDRAEFDDLAKLMVSKIIRAHKIGKSFTQVVAAVKKIILGSCMNLFIIIVTPLIVGFSVLTAWFIWINKADSRLLEMVTPIVGALFVSGLWTLKLIYSHSESKIQNRVGVVNIEYIGGGQLPIFQSLVKKPFELSDFLLWNRYMNQWNVAFLNRRPHNKFENIYDADPVHFRFFEYFFLKQLSERFSLGWDHDSRLMIKAPWGASGSESTGVPYEKIDRIFVKKVMGLESIPNEFIMADTQDEYYQFGIPKGSKFEIVRTDLGTTITIAHSRFRMTLGIEMGKALFNAYALRDTIVYPLFVQLQAKYGAQGVARNTEEIRMRNFTLSMNFEQNTFRKFNSDADLDRKFAENVWAHFAESLSWPKLEKWYQEAAFN